MMHRVNQMVASKMLGKLGYTKISVANDGFEGIEAIKNEYFDLVFLDLSMPGTEGTSMG